VSLPPPRGRVIRRRIEVGPIGPDVDLDTEVLYAADGRRLTYELAAEIAEEALARLRARERARLGKLTVRVPAELRAALQSIADTQGRRLADLSRDAFSEYVERHANRKSRRR
jgi:hypothetical protein